MTSPDTKPATGLARVILFGVGVAAGWILHSVSVSIDCRTLSAFRVGGQAYNCERVPGELWHR